jgi:RHS repeat-associated protein
VGRPRGRGPGAEEVSAVKPVSKFVYDGDGARVMQINISGTQVMTTAYAGAIEVQITATQRITKTYYSAGSQLIAMRQYTTPTTSMLYFLHGDHLGSVSVTTCGTGCGTAGTALSRQKFDAWGNVRSGGVGTMPTDVGFTGQRSDSYIKLVQMGARWYDPAIGRWISPDTIVPDPNNPQQFNRFGYVNNNPLRSKDSTGLCADADQTCKDIVKQIHDLYGIDLVDGTTIWNWITSQSVLSGLTEMAKQFASISGLNGSSDRQSAGLAEAISRIKDLFGGTIFYRDRDVNNNIAQVKIPGSVSFSDIWASGNDDFRYFYMAHEMGHIWDMHASIAHAFTGSISDIFADAVGSQSLFGLFYTVDGVECNCPRHAKSNAAEDWAESFATVMFPGYDNRTIGNKRESFVRVQIILLVNRNIYIYR